MVAGGLIILAACSKSADIYEWQEEVTLSDGSTIVATQRRSCELAVQGNDSFGCTEREAWITLDLPRFSSSPIVWHENLHPRILNVFNGRLYVVGEPPTSRESRLYGVYGKPVSPYISFVWEGGKWTRLPITQVPDAIYPTNMLIEGIPPKGVKLLTLALKASPRVSGNPRYDRDQKRVDPSYVEKTVPQGNG